MALLPDLATAALYALVVFLLVLGGLVIFVETIRASRLFALLAADIVAVALLAVVGEIGIAIVIAGFGLALIANQAFEWLTTR